MSKGIYITENTRLDYSGSALVNAALNGHSYEEDFSTIQSTYSDVDWQMLDLNGALQSSPAPEIVLLSRNAAPYRNAVKVEFPDANVQDYENWRSAH